jgi:hypothetical protein
MHRSNNRILTTHVGSLPRPPALRDLLIRYERGESINLTPPMLNFSEHSCEPPAYTP